GDGAAAGPLPAAAVGEPGGAPCRGRTDPSRGLRPPRGPGHGPADDAEDRDALRRDHHPPRPLRVLLAGGPRLSHRSRHAAEPSVWPMGLGLWLLVGVLSLLVAVRRLAVPVRHLGAGTRIA